MRAVLDSNVLISALLAPQGRPAALLRAWVNGEFELIASPLLLAELRRALAYPKLRKRLPPADSAAFADWLERFATLVPDPDAAPPRRSADPGDDYLIVLAAGARAVLVSGDRHLLALRAELPIESPADLVARLAED